MGRVALHLVAFMTRRELFQRFIGAPLAAAGVTLTNLSPSVRPILYRVETFKYNPVSPEGIITSRLTVGPWQIVRRPNLIEFLKRSAARGWAKSLDGGMRISIKPMPTQWFRAKKLQ